MVDANLMMSPAAFLVAGRGGRNAQHGEIADISDDEESEYRGSPTSLGGAQSPQFFMVQF